jgi:hypothetical protein
MKDWSRTRPGRRLRQRVLDPLSHEQFRRMVREAYPVVLPGRDSGWWQRWGHEVRR